MQRGTQLLLVFLVSAAVAIGAATLAGVNLGGERLRWFGTTPAPGAGTEPQTTARQAPAAGHLREAQDEYLNVLLDHPDNAPAMRGLITVRRQLAGDDPVVLRRQAAAYRQMMASGVEPPEHYSRQAMELLASASLQAAAAVESEQRSTAQRASAPAPSEVPRGAAPPDKGGLAPPSLPSAPGQSANETPAGSGAAPSPTKSPRPPSSPARRPEAPPASAPAQSPKAPPPAPPAQEPQAPPAPSTPGPQGPPAPPTGPAAPEQPAGGQAAPPAGTSDGTVAVVPPPSSGPAPAQAEGSLARVDCQKKTFVLSGANGDEEYAAAPNFTIYVRGVSSERLPDFCALQRHLGRAAVVWWVPDGDRKIAKSMSVVLPAQ